MASLSKTQRQGAKGSDERHKNRLRGTGWQMDRRGSERYTREPELLPRGLGGLRGSPASFR
jgi:hypothetical protein